MTDSRALLDAYANEDADHPNPCMPNREECAEKAFAAVRAVLELHVPISAGTTSADDVNCSVCLNEGDIADEHPDNWYPQRWPCGTVQAITTALEAK